MRESDAKKGLVLGGLKGEVGAIVVRSLGAGSDKGETEASSPPSSVRRSLLCLCSSSLVVLRVLRWPFSVIFALSLSGLRFVVSLSVFVLSLSLSLSLSSLCLLLSHLVSLSCLVLTCLVLVLSCLALLPLCVVLGS